MGGVSRPAPRGVGRGPGAAGAGSCAAEIPQASPRPEEAEAQEAERGQDQTRRHREDPQGSSSLDEMTTPKGWVGILDLFHVLERLWAVAHCFHAEGSDGAKQHVEERLRDLLQGRV